MKRTRRVYDAKFKAQVAIDAILDVYSRFIVGWNLHNSQDASNCIYVLRNAIAQHGVPEMKISMDGRGRPRTISG